MPGGFGGMGGLLNSALHAPGSAAPEPSQSADVYDVDRWKRADGLDNTTMVQTVRRDWEQTQKQSPGQKIKAWFQRKPAKPATPEETPLEPVHGTVAMPDIKRTQRRIQTNVEQEPAPNQPVQPQQSDPHAENYLGLDFPTALESFFTANPLNSAILAVDRLGFEPLSLNQVIAYDRTAPEISEAVPESASLSPTALRAQPKYKVRIVE